MDPNTNLEEIRACIAKMEGGLYPPAMLQEAARLAELVKTMDEWISSGGFYPDAWEHFGM